MHKKGQVSIFMVVSILLLILASFLIYIQKYAIERQSELEMRESSILDSDMEAFSKYLQSAFEGAVYQSLVVWGERGGFDNATTDLPKKTFTYDSDNIQTDGDTIVYLYNGANLYDMLRQEQSLKNLTSLIESTFQSSIDESMFEEKGYDFTFGEGPMAYINLNEEGATTTFGLQPNVRIGIDGFALTFSNFTAQLPMGVHEVITEVKRVTQELPLNNDLSSQGNPDDNIITCGFIDLLASPLSIIRITYTKPFLQHENYNFTFLANIDVSGCTS